MKLLFVKIISTIFNNSVVFLSSQFVATLIKHHQPVKICTQVSFEPSALENKQERKYCDREEILLFAKLSKLKANSSIVIIDGHGITCTSCFSSIWFHIFIHSVLSNVVFFSFSFMSAQCESDRTFTVICLLNMS